MATRLYRTDPGTGHIDVTEAVGQPATRVVQLVVDFDAVIPGNPNNRPTRHDVVEAITRLREHILRGNWPPA